MTNSVAYFRGLRDVCGAGRDFFTKDIPLNIVYNYYGGVHIAKKYNIFFVGLSDIARNSFDE